MNADEAPIMPAAPVVDIKKRPGRPRKTVENIQVEIKGVVDTSANPIDYLELVYCNPRMFKKLHTLCKNYEAREIEMIFSKREVVMKAVDHTKKTTIYIRIDGDRLNWYYCKDTITICVKRESLDKIFATLDKNHYKITFMLRENYRSTLYVIIKDSDYDSDDNYEVEVVHKQQDPVVTVDDDTNYPIRFVMGCKYFKKKISDIGKLSSNLTIQKVWNEPLNLTFPSAKLINYNGIYGNPEKIKLVANIEPEDIFNISIAIANIKPFSNSNIGDEVAIAADKQKKLSLTTNLDKKDNGWAVQVKIYSEINTHIRANIGE